MVTARVTRQQAKTQEQEHVSIERCNILEAEDEQITDPLLAMSREREKIGDSITVVLD